MELRWWRMELSESATQLQGSITSEVDAGLQELMIESYFPADDETRQFFLKLDQGAD
jgi:hypothetical protein